MDQNRLNHSGVKGMKWGVRNQSTPSNTNTRSQKPVSSKKQRPPKSKGEIASNVALGAMATYSLLLTYAAYKM